MAQLIFGSSRIYLRMINISTSKLVLANWGARGFWYLRSFETFNGNYNWSLIFHVFFEVPNYPESADRGIVQDLHLMISYQMVEKPPKPRLS